MTSTAPASRSRFQLLLITALFLAPFLSAWGLFASGWRPPGTRQHGFLYAPAQDFRSVQARNREGKAITWENTERRWHLLLLAPTTCDARCAVALDAVHRVWVGLGRHAADVDVHFVGTPDAATQALLARERRFDVVSLSGSPLPLVPARTAGLPVYLVDPHGYLVMRFDPGFEPGGLRRDLKKLVR